MLAPASPSFATQYPPTKVDVRYEDLTLATASDQKRLYRRIHNAARKICETADQRDINMRAAVGQCMASTMTSSNEMAARLIKDATVTTTGSAPINFIDLLEILACDEHGCSHAPRRWRGYSLCFFTSRPPLMSPAMDGEQ